jgi:hypothetical protein
MDWTALRVSLTGTESRSLIPARVKLPILPLAVTKFAKRADDPNAINEQVRTAIADSGETHYRIGKEADIAPSVLDRFVNRETECLTGRNIDRLCDHFGLELCRKKGRTGVKQPVKKGAPSSKRTVKKTGAAKRTAKKK